MHRSSSAHNSHCSGNVNGAVSSNVVSNPFLAWHYILIIPFQYRARDQPWYPLGHGLVLMYVGFGIIASVLYLFLLRAENARRDRGERDEVIKGIAGGDPKNGTFNSVEDAKREKGDEWSGYRYTV